MANKYRRVLVVKRNGQRQHYRVRSDNKHYAAVKTSHVRNVSRVNKGVKRTVGRAVARSRSDVEREISRKMMDAFRDWGSDKKQIQRGLAEMFDRAPLNIESDGTYQKRLSRDKYGDTKIRYDPSGNVMYVTLRGSKEYEYDAF